MDRPKRNTQPPERLGAIPTARTNDGFVPFGDVDRYQYSTQPTGEELSQDKNYEEPLSRPQASARGRPKKVRPDTMTHNELLDAYLGLEQQKKDVDSTLKDTRAKRAEDRKDGAEEKALRIQLQSQVKQLKGTNHELRQRITQQKTDFDAALDQQKTNFAKAQKHWFERNDTQAYPCLPDNVLQTQFQELYTKCTDWAREWIEEDLIDDPAGKFESIMSHCCNPNDALLLPSATRKYKSAKQQAVRLMGFAHLARLINNRFFSSPFCLFSHSERAGLDSLYRKYKKGWGITHGNRA